MVDQHARGQRATVAVIGAGPAGLMAAAQLATLGHTVTVYDRMPSPARKFLMAGRGGLNITHSEGTEAFRARYGARAGVLAPALDTFPPEDLVAWVNGLGIETFTGSSGRIFPRAMKASPLLRAWLQRLDGLGVTLRPRHDWCGFGAGGSLMFATPEGQAAIHANATVLALGGASWPRLGSNGAWAAVLERIRSKTEIGAEKALARARMINPYFEEYLTGRRKLPKQIPDISAPGSPEEAASALRIFGETWGNDREGMYWLFRHN